MSRPAFARGAKARGLCDICGFSYKLDDLKDQFENHVNTHIKACNQCWSADHPQLQVGKIIVVDPQALRDPRPDSREYSSMRSLTLPILPTIICGGNVGVVTVSIA